jgi:hypothetical protein
MAARAILSFALVVAVTGIASAEPTKVGVLGLEVAGVIDIDGTTQAKNITEVMRSQVRPPRFTLAPNSKKELIDEKVANNCDSEATDCMTKIAKKVGATVLIFGRIERKADKDGVDAYQLSLKLLDTEKKTTKPATAWISLKDVGDGKLESRTIDAFNAITGVESVTPPPPPDGGLIVEDPPKPLKKPGNGWKTATYVSGAATVVLLGGFVFTALKTESLAKDCTEDPTTGKRSGTGCADGPTYSKLSFATGIGAGAVGVFAIVAAYKGFISSSKESSQPTVGRSTRKRSRFAVTPVIAPEGAGATVRFDW